MKDAWHHDKGQIEGIILMFVKRSGDLSELLGSMAVLTCHEGARTHRGNGGDTLIVQPNDLGAFEQLCNHMVRHYRRYCPVTFLYVESPTRSTEISSKQLGCS